MLRAQLDAIRLVVDVEGALLDFLCKKYFIKYFLLIFSNLINFARRIDESFLNPGRRFGTRLHKYEAMLTGKGLALFAFYLAAAKYFVYFKFFNPKSTFLNRICCQ